MVLKYYGNSASPPPNVRSCRDVLDQPHSPPPAENTTHKCPERKLRKCRSSFKTITFILHTKN